MLLPFSHRRSFGATGLSVAPVAFGSAPVGLLATERDAASRLMHRLLDDGVNLLDTAAAYLGAEALIGETLADRRSDYILVTKCGADMDANGWRQATSKSEVVSHIDRSLTRLRTDVIDVLLIHSLPLDVLKQGWAFEALDDARAAGKIRFGGYSGDNEAAAWAVQQPGIAVLETSVSLVDQVNIDVVLPIATKRGVAVMTKRSIANACWRASADHHARYDAYVAPYRQRFAAMGLELASIAPGIDDWAELALRFTLAQPQVHTAIVGGTSIDRILAILRYATKGGLPAAAVSAIRASFAKARAGGGDWAGLS
ncbi:MAG: aldo/keto reductase [Phycisphaerae bacterium]|nr:aldo/keto reductase [Phycisphaerae bacterium]